MCKWGAALVAAVVGSGAHSVLAMNIVVTPDATMVNNTLAVDAFNRAAQSWASAFTDDITVNISAGYSGAFSNPSALGSTSSVLFQANYNFFLGKIMESADSNDGILAHLPDLAHFSATLPVGVTFSNKFLATKANFKALGYTGLDEAYGATDSTITFNSTFAFDYDNRDGVTPNTIDFQTLAAHEIGHALGFISSVDTVDTLKHNGTGGSLVITPLDLFRFQDNVAGKDPATVADFTNYPRYLDTGGTPIFDDLTQENALSSGTFTGDGFEASHWRNAGSVNPLLGVMNPSLNYTVIEAISANDIRALDLIGYDAVPEPAALGVAVWFIAFVQRPMRDRARRGGM
jgi:hypothetical protein